MRALAFGLAPLGVALGAALASPVAAAPRPASPHAATARPAVRPAPAAASRFVTELPVMAGLWESGSGYDYPLGGARLAETRLIGRAPLPQVQSFYDGALAGAGWRRAGPPWAFRRGRERLVVHLAPHRAAGSQTEALFVVTPDAAAPAERRAPHGRSRP